MKSAVILARAKEIALGQGRLALSPAEKGDDGSVTLCAGSCIARAVLEVNADAELLADFDRLVLTEDKLKLLPSIFRKYGLSETGARRAIRENDLRRESERLSWFLSLSTV